MDELGGGGLGWAVVQEEGRVSFAEEIDGGPQVGDTAD